MKKLLVGLTLLFSMSVFALGDHQDSIISNDIVNLMDEKGFTLSSYSPNYDSETYNTFYSDNDNVESCNQIIEKVKEYVINHKRLALVSVQKCEFTKNRQAQSSSYGVRVHSGDKTAGSVSVIQLELN